MSWPQTVNGRVYTANDFANTAYLAGLPDLIQDLATQFSQSANATSTSSLTLGTGTKNLTIQAAKYFGVGQPVVIARTSAPSTTYMEGRITAYDSVTGAMSVSVGTVLGSGTFTDWTITIGGSRATATLPLSTAEGGTGATTAGQALTNLGLTAVAQTLIAQSTQALMRTTGLGLTTIGDALATTASASAARSTLGAGATGDALYTAATAASARATLGAGATGESVFASSTTSAARTALGVSSIGDSVFTAANVGAAQTAIGVSAFMQTVLDDTSAVNARTTLGLNTAQITVVIDGGGAPITTGVKGYVTVPFNCTITKARALGDQTGSIAVDVWKDTYANYPPTVADSIVASAPITISSAVKSEDATLTGWSKSLTAGDVLGFNVNSVSNFVKVAIELTVTKA